MENIKSSSLKNKKQVISDLKEIHQLVSDSKEGYQSAWDSTDNPELKALFSKLSGERIVYAAELGDHIAEHDEEAEPENDGFLHGMHHTWLNIKQVLSKKDDKALLVAISAGERAALEKYDECIANIAEHADHITLLTDQRDGLKAAVDEIETLIVRENN